MAPQPVYLLVARVHFRLDELARCLGAALTGSPSPDVWMLLLTAEGDRAVFVQGPQQLRDAGEDAVLPELQSLIETKELRCTAEVIKEDVAEWAREMDLASDLFLELHEDYALALSAAACPAVGYKRVVMCFGVHEDFLSEVGAIAGVVSPMCQAVRRVSLGPVALHSSACIHLLQAMLARGLAVAEGDPPPPFKLSPVMDLHTGVRTIPRRSPIRIWVALPQSPPSLRQLAIVAGVWTSKCAYHAKDTRLTFIDPEEGGAVTVDRTLLDEMPRHHAEGRAPNEANVMHALAAVAKRDGQGEPWEEALRKATDRMREVLVLEVDPHAPPLPLGGDEGWAPPHPRDTPLFVMMGCSWPTAHPDLLVTRARFSLPGCDSPARGIVVLQMQHSVGCLTAAVRKHGTVSRHANDDPRMSVAELREKHFSPHGKDEEGPQEGGDTILSPSPLVVRGVAGAINFHGQVAFVGFRDAQGGVGVQVVVLFDKDSDDMRVYETVRKLHAGDTVVFRGKVGRTAQGRLSLFADEIIEVQPAKPSPPAVVKVHEDHEVVVCGKPSGVLSHPTTRMKREDYPTALCLASSSEPHKLHPIHTTGRDVSGIVVFGRRAKKDLAHVAISRRQYVVLAVGAIPDDAEWECAEPLKDVVDSPEGGLQLKPTSSRKATKELMPARTHFKVLARYPKASAALLLATPYTACTRQVRRHLACCGLCVVGDQLQGKGTVNRTFQRTYAFRSTALHLYRAHVKDTEHLAPLPFPFATLLRCLPCGDKPDPLLAELLASAQDSVS
eukprot:Sspe_Gene.99760::Locus_73587_Transcript_1_1_Confidence_1.000_Length_2426::g.99760::m.99760